MRVFVRNELARSARVSHEALGDLSRIYGDFRVGPIAPFCDSEPFASAYHERSYRLAD